VEIAGGGSVQLRGRFRGAGLRPPIVARRVFVHPAFDRLLEKIFERDQHDVVALVLGDAPSVAPEVVGTTRLDATVSSVGYGRTSVGDVDVSTGYTSERKSTDERVVSMDARNI
jgi:hypothetical protein